MYVEGRDGGQGGEKRGKYKMTSYSKSLGSKILGS